MARDLKRALDAYVSGRNGGWDSELKSPPRAAATPGETAPAETESIDVESVYVEQSAHTGVPVPLRLHFERGPGMWRSNLEDESRR